MSKILIADDDIAVNNLLRYFLKTRFKGKIISAFNGNEAIEKCLTHQPSLVFMDVMMPVKDGITSIKELRKAGFKNPIVIVTASHEANDEICYQSGANIIIRKPVSRDQILDQLKCVSGYT